MIITILLLDIVFDQFIWSRQFMVAYGFHRDMTELEIVVELL